MKFNISSFLIIFIIIATVGVLAWFTIRTIPDPISDTTDGTIIAEKKENIPPPDGFRLAEGNDLDGRWHADASSTGVYDVITISVIGNYTATLGEQTADEGFWYMENNTLSFFSEKKKSLNRVFPHVFVSEDGTTLYLIKGSKTDIWKKQE